GPHTIGGGASPSCSSCGARVAFRECSAPILLSATIAINKHTLTSSGTFLGVFMKCLMKMRCIFTSFDPNRGFNLWMASPYLGPKITVFSVCYDVRMRDVAVICLHLIVTVFRIGDLEAYVP